jgi:hypothetical protein
MPGSDAGSGYNLPPCIIPEEGQIPENLVDSPLKERCDVFHDDESGSQFANEAGKLEPEARTVALESCSEAGVADVLARKTPNKGIAVREDSGSDFPNVGEAGDSRPSEAEDLSAERVLFDLKDRLPEAGLLEAEFKAPDSAE